MPKDVQEQFGRAAEHYVKSAWHNQPDVLSQLAARVNSSGGTIIDIGSGTGHTAFAFAPCADKIVAVDLTPEMLAITEREAAAKSISNLTGLLANAEELPLEDGSVRGVTCRVAAHHFLHPAKFISEVHRVLEPGGWFLFIDTVGPESDKARSYVDRVETIRDPSHQSDLSVSQWLDLTSTRFDVEWQEQGPKPLDLEDWMERMHVSEGDRTELRKLILESEGVVRDYFLPLMKDNRWFFHLCEWTILFRKV